MTPRSSIHGIVTRVLFAAAVALFAPGQSWAQTSWTCPLDVLPPPGEVGGDSHASGGMAGNGWDGAGTNAATVLWHVEGTTGDTGAGQRQAIINALQRWADIVQITFQEVPTADRDESIDLHYLAGDHSAAEPAEAGDPDCSFAGTNTLAHAGFPPGVNSTCVSPMAETFSGNVHFNTAFTWEPDDDTGAGPFSIELIATHEIGHSIGLTHSANGDIMQPSFSDMQSAYAPSANDVHNLQQGYAAGVGSVVTLEQSGIWVDGSFGGVQWGVVGNEFTTVQQAVDAVPAYAAGVDVFIVPGVYNENFALTSGSQDRTFTLRANGAGNVVIGN